MRDGGSSGMHHCHVVRCVFECQKREKRQQQQQQHQQLVTRHSNQSVLPLGGGYRAHSVSVCVCVCLWGSSTPLIHQVTPRMGVPWTRVTCTPDAMARKRTNLDGCLQRTQGCALPNPVDPIGRFDWIGNGPN